MTTVATVQRDPQLPLLPRNDLEKKYRAWKAEHRAVYDLFLRFARERMDRGRRFGVKALAERVRWEVATAWAEDADGFKVNNSHIAYLARDLLVDEPALETLIQMRRIRA